ncbi:sigma-70 family RNA polymerase sigma factor [Hippea maritima]|uniref:Putative RNA polymerase, sigma 70 family subunit n=1 Tax=Hippea maritima (strain ATCC 700847 / DSM 10411 / MH2) TaxID=760142 RepID=F2LVX7_HIPMA|nr:RNA polymerase sigma factor RpoD/SigA [Hippea maritima]AEA33911.1 putative RNA polymerase, sigma 70 family subunit [Hippea maritima DSM 10411]
MESEKIDKNEQLAINDEVDLAESSALTSYLKEISKIPVLSAEEEKELGRRIKKGDKEALKKLVKHNLRFVVSVAKKYKNLGIPLLDLINEGNLGLIKAAKKFDPDRNTKFISYAAWWIKQSIMKYITEQSTPIRIPLKAKSRISKIDTIKEDYRQKFDEEPMNGEISEISDLSEREIKNAELARFYFDSLDDYVSDDKDILKGDLISLKEQSIEDEHIQKSLIEEVNKFLSELPEREQDIIKLRYGLYDGRPRTLREIGEKYGISKERVRQLENNILNKLKKRFKEYKE